MLTSTVILSQLSRLRERTLETCTPRLRWTPEHVIHSAIPRLMLAHSTSASVCTGTKFMCVTSTLMSHQHHIIKSPLPFLPPLLHFSLDETLCSPVLVQSAHCLFPGTARISAIASGTISVAPPPSPPPSCCTGSAWGHVSNFCNASAVVFCSASIQKCRSCSLSVWNKCSEEGEMTCKQQRQHK